MHPRLKPPEFKGINELLIPDEKAKAIGVYVKNNPVKAGRYSRHSKINDQEIGHGIIVTEGKNEEKNAYAIFRHHPEEKDKENKEIAQGSFGKIKWVQSLLHGSDAKKVFVLKTIEILDDDIGHEDLLAVLRNKSLSYQREIDLNIIAEYLIDLHVAREAFKKDKNMSYDALLTKHEIKPEQVEAFKNNPNNLQALKDILLPSYESVKYFAESEFNSLQKLGKTRGGSWIRDTKRKGQKKYEFIMEYEPGKTLDELKNEKLTPEEAKEAMLLILKELKKAHDHNILHADIKGSNILFYLQRNRQGKVTAMRAALVDYGLSFQLNSSNERICVPYRGTPGYSAPEIKSGNPASPFTKKADIYSMGVTLGGVFSQYFKGWDSVRMNEYFEKMTAENRKQRPSIDEAIEYFNNFHFTHAFKQILIGALVGGLILLSAAFSGIGIAALGLYAWIGALAGGAALGAFSGFSHFFEKHREIILVSLAISLLVITGVLSMGAIPAIAGVFTAIGSVFVSSAIPGLATTVGAGIVGSILPLLTMPFIGIYNSVKKFFSSKKEPEQQEPSAEIQVNGPMEEKAESLENKDVIVELKALPTKEYKQSSELMIQMLSPTTERGILKEEDTPLSPESTITGAPLFLKVPDSPTYKGEPTTRSFSQSIAIPNPSTDPVGISVTGSPTR